MQNRVGKKGMRKRGSIILLLHIEQTEYVKVNQFTNGLFLLFRNLMYYGLCRITRIILLIIIAYIILEKIAHSIDLLILSSFFPKCSPTNWYQTNRNDIETYYSGMKHHTLSTNFSVYSFDIYIYIFKMLQLTKLPVGFRTSEGCFRNNIV